MKDRELTRLLQAHPEEGLEAAMLEYAPLVKGILCRILPQNPCDREECMADVFVALWRRRGAQPRHCLLQRAAPPRDGDTGRRSGRDAGRAGRV